MPTRRTALLVLIALAVAPASALADPPAATRASRAAAVRDAECTTTRQRSVVCGVVNVPGERQQPQAFDLSSRSGTGYVYSTDEAHFTPQVVTATRRAPF